LRVNFSDAPVQQNFDEQDGENEHT
jgi:hypothetical protein